MGKKIEVPMDKRFRMTLPIEIREYLKINEGDDLWYEITNGKVTVGRIEVHKKIIE